MVRLGQIFKRSKNKEIPVKEKPQVTHNYYLLTEGILPNGAKTLYENEYEKRGKGMTALESLRADEKYKSLVTEFSYASGRLFISAGSLSEAKEKIKKAVAEKFDEKAIEEIISKNEELGTGLSETLKTRSKIEAFYGFKFKTDVEKLEPEAY